jgi:hypothetical protein
MAQKGIISSTLDNLVEPVSYFKNIPFIGEYVGTATSILKGASGIFSAFGWSKPIYESIATPIFNQYTRFLHNFSGANVSHVMALDAANHLEPLTNVGGTVDDEMSFSYLKSIPAYVDDFTWDVTSSADATIYSKNISQMFSIRTNAINSQNYTLKYGPPYSFLSRYFKYYRGSVNLNLKFVKTQFHTGKVMVVFEPRESGTVVVGNSFSQNGLRTIIDLKDSTDVTINLPYLSNQSYLPMGTPIGTVYVKVLNPLTVNDTVSSSIKVLCFYSAGEDYEVACPVATGGPAVVAQMNIVSNVSSVRRIGGYPMEDPSMTPVKTCMGEAFVSIKQLLTSSRAVYRNSIFAPIVDFPVTSFSTMLFWPWSFGLPTAPSLPTTLTYAMPPYGGDYVAELTSGFAYYRGGLRYTFPAKATTNQLVYSSLIPARTATKVIPPSYPSGFGSLPRTITTSELNPAPIDLTIRSFNGDTEIGTDITVPYYGPTPFRLTHMQSGATPDIPTTRDVNSDLIAVTAATPSAAVLAAQGLLRAASDDFQLMYFCGFSGWV